MEGERGDWHSQFCGARAHHRSRRLQPVFRPCAAVTSFRGCSAPPLDTLPSPVTPLQHGGAVTRGRIPYNSLTYSIDEVLSFPLPPRFSPLQPTLSLCRTQRWRLTPLLGRALSSSLGLSSSEWSSFTYIITLSKILTFKLDKNCF